MKMGQAPQEYNDCFFTAFHEDYLHWVEGYVKRGGLITHFERSAFPEKQNIWFMAAQTFTLQPAFGASARMVIVPKGLACSYDRLGHNNIFYLENYSVADEAYVPCYVGSP